MNTWLLILGMLAITFVIRYSFFAWPDLRFPRAIEQGLHCLLYTSPSPRD